jgi:hypothetical protein
MRILKTVSTFFAAFAFFVAPVGAQGIDKSIIGKWRLTKVLDSADITALDDAEAEKLVGKSLSIQADKVQFLGRTCQDPDFEVERAETWQYFARNANASADNLGLPNPVTAIHVDCTYVYKKPPDKLVVHWKGFFFDAVRER